MPPLVTLMPLLLMLPLLSVLPMLLMLVILMMPMQSQLLALALLPWSQAGCPYNCERNCGAPTCGLVAAALALALTLA